MNTPSGFSISSYAISVYAGTAAARSAKIAALSSHAYFPSESRLMISHGHLASSGTADVLFALWGFGNDEQSLCFFTEYKLFETK